MKMANSGVISHVSMTYISKLSEWKDDISRLFNQLHIKQVSMAIAPCQPGRVYMWWVAWHLHSSCCSKPHPQLHTFLPPWHHSCEKTYQGLQGLYNLFECERIGMRLSWLWTWIVCYASCNENKLDSYNVFRVSYRCALINTMAMKSKCYLLKNWNWRNHIIILYADT